MIESLTRSAISRSSGYASVLVVRRAIDVHEAAGSTTSVQHERMLVSTKDTLLIPLFSILSLPFAGKNSNETKTEGPSRSYRDGPSRMKLHRLGVPRR